MLGGNNLANMMVLGGPMESDPAPSTHAAGTGCLGLPPHRSSKAAAALGKASAAHPKAGDFHIPAFTKPEKPKRTKKPPLSCTMFG